VEGAGVLDSLFMALPALFIAALAALPRLLIAPPMPCDREGVDAPSVRANAADTIARLTRR
jgi:hypothetical protein